MPGVASLVLFAWLLTLVPTAAAGRAFAAYGGVYIAASLAWLWTVEKARPDNWDAVGAALSRLLQVLVTAAAQPAHDARTGSDAPAVVVRVQVHQDQAMDRMVAAGLSLRVGARSYRVEPVTAVGERSHILPEGTTAASLLAWVG